jgi:hypothetical protein
MKDQSARCDINDEVIEPHAMGRLQDATLREHLDTCEGSEGASLFTKS